MRYIVSAMLFIVGISHLVPLTGVLSSEQLASLYGMTFNEPNLEIVMRHRAVFFGLLGAFLVYAAFHPAVQVLAFVASFVAVVSFLGIAWSVGDYNEHIGRVFAADIGVLICLLIAAGAYAFTSSDALLMNEENIGAMK